MDEVKGTIASCYQHVREAYEGLEELGCTMPDERNVENLRVTIESYIGGSSWDPSNPTLEGLKEAINNGEDIETGLEIPDDWNGNNNPLIVAQKLDGSNNSSYGGAEGVILVRKFLEPTSYNWAGAGSNPYPSSTLIKYLQGDYLTKCSDSLKDILSELSVPYYNGSTYVYPSSKWHIFSVNEVAGLYNNASTVKEGFVFDYWKNTTGITSASNNANSGRVKSGRTGGALYWYLRSRFPNGSYGYGAYPTGNIDGVVKSQATSNCGILPFCFIAKDK